MDNLRKAELIKALAQSSETSLIICQLFCENLSVSEAERAELVLAVHNILKGYLGVSESTRCLIDVVGLSYGLLTE